MEDARIFRATPHRVYDVLSYYNVGVNATRSSRDNPLRVLASVTAPSDFVVVKIVRAAANHDCLATLCARVAWLHSPI